MSVMKTAALSLLVLATAVLPATPGRADPGLGHRDVELLAPAWAAAPLAGLIGSSPTYADGSVYYVEYAYPVNDLRFGQVITRRDAASAKALPFGAPVVDALVLTDPVTDGVRLFTVSAYEQGEPVAHLRAYTLDGFESWSRAVPGEQFILTVVLAGPLVVAASETGCDETGNTLCQRTEIFAWSAADGEPAWHRTVTGGTPKIVAAAGRLAVRTTGSTGSTGTLTALDASTGDLLWEQSGLAVGQIAADADNVYLAAGQLCAFRVATGKRRWCVRDRSYHFVTVAGDALFTVTYQDYPAGYQQVVALNTAGRGRWAVDARPTGPLTVADGVVYLQHFTDGDEPAPPHPVDRPTELLALRSTTGVVLNRLPVSDGYSHGSVAVGGDRVFTTAALTSVRAYEPTR